MILETFRTFPLIASLAAPIASTAAPSWARARDPAKLITSVEGRVGID
jgi:hypothetical protein